MSPGVERERARRWLADQLEQLDKLRNASPRDPSFKLWRQNTLTVLQRIWPAQPHRSERFRRITFSPASAKPLGAQVRECFARGCIETHAYLQSLIEEIEIVGTPSEAEGLASAPYVGGSPDADVPMIDLPSGATSAPGASAPRYAMEENVLDLGSASAPPASAGDEHPAAGAPKLNVELRTPGDTSAPPRSADESPPARGHMRLEPSAAAPPSAPPNPVPGAASEVHAQPAQPAPSARRAGRATRAHKPAVRGKLKNMLGFGDDAAPAGPAPAVAPLSSAVPASPAPPAAPAPATETTPAAASTPPAPVAPPATRQSGPHPLDKAASDAAAAVESDSLSRVTADFMRSSPILGLQGRPVQRTSDVTEFMDPDAVALATLAADLGRLGVPEAARASLRATLTALAQQIEAGHPEWKRVGDAVAISMTYPALARRLVPVLLPWFERAA